ncbi:MAG: hypothetical protein ACRDT6_16785, partial [Micromonosporaceae bacterium]
ILVPAGARERESTGVEEAPGPSSRTGTTPDPTLERGRDTPVTTGRAEGRGAPGAPADRLDPAGAPPARTLGREPDTEREVIGGNEVRIVRDEPAYGGGRVPDSRAPTSYDAEPYRPDAPTSQPLYVPDEWRDEYSDRP